MKTVIFSILGTTLDQKGARNTRWQRWRPTIGLCQQADFTVDKLVILYHEQYQNLYQQIRQDIAEVSPITEVCPYIMSLKDPWDFEQVYGELYDFARSYSYQHQSERYFIHITTGTHVAQICFYLLTEANFIKAKLIQTSPDYKNKNVAGSHQIIDLDLSKYDQIASRFRQESDDAENYLKQGIATKNILFNKMISQIEKIAIRSKAPILLMGPTGAGKTQLAKTIYALKKKRGLVYGDLVIVNCATLASKNSMSALFGHTKGAFIGATATRKGLLREANGGMIFLDEIGELGLKEQAMLLRAIEEKKFLPVGSDKERSSDFDLIAGSNMDLAQMVKQNRFRKDLLARIHVWTYQLPSLPQRLEDFEPNLDFELNRYASQHNQLIRFNKDARKKYLTFALSKDALWLNNFRDLNSSVSRMATLSDGGRITLDIVEDEINRLSDLWQLTSPSSFSPTDITAMILGKNKADKLDLYEHIQFAGIVEVCRASKSLAEAGRKLFNKSRLEKSSQNDSHRIKQILKKYDVTFDDLNIPVLLGNTRF